MPEDATHTRGTPVPRQDEYSSGIPTDDDLNEMAQKIAKCDFEQIASPEHRAIVMDLAIKAYQAGDIADIAVWYRKSKLWDGF